MDALLPPLKTPDSAWGTNYIYWYWFEKRDEQLTIHFELGGLNLNEEQALNSKLLIQAAGKKERAGYRYFRLFHSKAKLSQDDYETSLRNSVKRLVKAALENEKKLLEKVEELRKV